MRERPRNAPSICQSSQGNGDGRPPPPNGLTRELWCGAHSPGLQTSFMCLFILFKTKITQMNMPATKKQKQNQPYRFLLFSFFGGGRQMWRRGLFGDDSDPRASFLRMIFPPAQSCCFVKLTQLESGERTQAGKGEDSRTEKKPAESWASRAGSGSVPWRRGVPAARSAPPPATRGAAALLALGAGESPPAPSPAPPPPHSARHRGGHLCQSFVPHRATCEDKNKKFGK